MTGTKRLAMPLHTFAIVALGVWMGGLIALGAIAAPVVFGMVAMPDSADAMAVVFARFDKVVIVLSAGLLITDGVLVLTRDRTNDRAVQMSALDRFRPVLTTVLAVVGVGEASAVTPQIASLHAAGAVRGVGDTGARLESLHNLAESLGKAELALAVLLVILHVRAVQMNGKSVSDG